MVSVRPARGFTYLAVLFAVAMMGAAMAATGIVWKTASTREKEAELLWVGDQYRRAIIQYASQGAGASGRFPHRLEELLEDRRLPVQKRYLRRLYPDPMTGRPDWVLIEAPEGGIVGIHSRSTARPLRVANFPPGYEDFKDKASYADWRFAVTGPPPGAEEGAEKGADKAKAEAGKPGAPAQPRSAAQAGMASEAPKALPGSSVTLQAPGAPALESSPPQPAAEPSRDNPAPVQEPAPAAEAADER